MDDQNPSDWTRTETNFGFETMEPFTYDRASLDGTQPHARDFVPFFSEEGLQNKMSKGILRMDS